MGGQNRLVLARADNQGNDWASEIADEGSAFGNRLGIVNGLHVGEGHFGAASSGSLVLASTSALSHFDITRVRGRVFNNAVGIVGHSRFELM